MYDVYVEIFQAAPTGAYTLDFLVQNSNLTDKTPPHSLSDFAGYTHNTYPAYGTFAWADCGAHTGYNGFDYYHDGMGGYYTQPNGLRCEFGIE